MVDLRKLAKKDTQLILEWMKDPEVNRFFRFDPEKINEETVLSFINNSYSESERHYAVSDENDIYQGTVSLKNIDQTNGSAEYAISMRRLSQRKGYAHIGTSKILRVAFNELGLHRIYLNVFEDNTRARLFYEKFGFIYEGCFKDHLYIRGAYKSLCWYRILDSEFTLMD